MYSRDIDNVKSRLRDLWTQYGSSGASGVSSGASGGSTTGTRGPNTNGADAQEAAIEEMLLFPSYAFRDERLKVWRVQVRGWAFCRNPNTRRVRLAASLIRRFIKVAPGGESDQLLMERISHLFAAQPQSSDMAKVAMAGIVEPSAFELHTYPHPAAHTPDDKIASMTAVNLLDAPLVLASRFDPRSPPVQQQQQQQQQQQDGHAGHLHDRFVPGPLESGGQTIMQKALQIDAFAWQNLGLDDGQFQGEILVGYNELEWLIQSYCGSKHDKGTASCGRRLIELRGKLFGWTDEQTITGLVHLVEPQGISVVSDIDDTIKASNITAEKRIVLETVFSRPLQAVPGMSKLYREWYDRGCEFHYVSNSPWQLYPSLDEFFHQHQFPPGSAHLRSFDPNDLLSIKNYTGTPQLKRDTIERLFSVFPQRKYILVGDCGEQDLETYTELARRFPDHIVRIYIRDLFAPMAVPSVTTDTQAAGNTAINDGLIPIGITGARQRDSNQNRGAAGGGRSGRSGEPDLMHFPLSDEEGSEDLKAAHEERVRPVPPPKPIGLQASRPPPSSTSTTPVPPPKPPRKAATANHQRTDSSNSTGGYSTNDDANSGAIPVDATAPPLPRKPTIPPPIPPRNRAGGTKMPGGWTPGPQPVAPMDGIPPPLTSETTFEKLEARAQLLRAQAQQWMAFYAQQFYVAPTKSFLRYAHVFLPMVEKDMRIIEYDSIHAETIYNYQQQMQNTPPSNNVSGVAGNMARTESGSGNGASLFGRMFDIPEPPPPESQLVRNERRLLLWKRFVNATRGLPQGLCRLFVDASDIDQDPDLTHVFARHSQPQM